LRGSGGCPATARSGRTGPTTAFPRPYWGTHGQPAAERRERAGCVDACVDERVDACVWAGRVGVTLNSSRLCAPLFRRGAFPFPTPRGRKRLGGGVFPLSHYRPPFPGPLSAFLTPVVFQEIASLPGLPGSGEGFGYKSARGAFDFARGLGGHGTIVSMVPTERHPKKTQPFTPCIPP
jgi:hypothetical protein